MRTSFMTKPMRTLAAVAAVALIGVAGSGYFALGQLQPAAEGPVSGGAAPLRPSYLVSVREPTAAELEQRRALAEVKLVPRTIDLSPRNIEVAATPTLPAGPKARIVSDVNVRSGPGTDSAALSVAASGAEVIVLGQQGGWTEIAFPDGGNGWIASRFLAQ